MGKNIQTQRKKKVPLQWQITDADIQAACDYFMEEENRIIEIANQDNFDIKDNLSVLESYLRSRRDLAKEILKTPYSEKEKLEYQLNEWDNRIQELLKI